MNYKVILASASPRRQELLKSIFSDFQIVIPEVDEIVPNGITTNKTAEYLANLKCDAVAKKFPEHLVIAADTVVILNDKILGKPKTKEEAKEMLTDLSDNMHKVITGCSINKDGLRVNFSVETVVQFYKLSNKEIDEYIASGDCFDKAGGYGIQTNGKLFVKKINGDFYNVVGLPVAELHKQIITNFKES